MASALPLYSRGSNAGVTLVPAGDGGEQISRIPAGPRS
jgi:hypothetical protein